MCRAHGVPGRFLPQLWVNAQPVPRFYPNAVTLSASDDDLAEQRSAIELLVASNLPTRWAVKDSFARLDLTRQGFEVLFEASWIRGAWTGPAPATDIVWSRETAGGDGLPWDDANFALFRGRRGFQVVAGGMLYRAAGVVGLSNVVAESADAVTVWRSLAVLASQAFPRLPLVGYESGGELQAALDAGFEIGDPLRVWVRSGG
ncbi:MAG: hypothetical protein U1E23_08285 [Reyranellaceae bacterium]